MAARTSGWSKDWCLRLFQKHEGEWISAEFITEQHNQADHRGDIPIDRSTVVSNVGDVRKKAERNGWWISPAKKVDGQTCFKFLCYSPGGAGDITKENRENFTIFDQLDRIENAIKDVRVVIGQDVQFFGARTDSTREKVIELDRKMDRILKELGVEM